MKHQATHTPIPLRRTVGGAAALLALATAAALLGACGGSSDPSPSASSSAADGSSVAGTSSKTILSSGGILASSALLASSQSGGQSQGGGTSSTGGSLSSAGGGGASSAGGGVATANTQNCPYDAAANTLACAEKTYRTVTLGGKVWMAENLRYGAYQENIKVLNPVIEGARYFCYQNDESICATDGGLYHWHTAMGFDQSCDNGTKSCASQIAPGNHQGICPVGWHIPKKDEWTALAVAAGGTPSKMFPGDFENLESLKSNSFGGTNASGFNFLGAGMRVGSGGGAFMTEEKGQASGARRNMTAAMSINTRWKWLMGGL